jgi:hypothetical protein
MFVRTRPEDFARVVVTSEGAARIDADYRIGATNAKLMEEAHKYYPDVGDWAAILAERSPDSNHPNVQRSADQRFPDANPGAEIRDAFNAVNWGAVNYASEHAAKMPGKIWSNGLLIDNPDPRWSIAHSAREWLRDAITRAFKEGMSPAQLAVAIRTSGILNESATPSKYAAIVIAHTEVAIVNVRSHAIACMGSGATRKKSLLSADHGYSDLCDAAAAAGEVPIDYDYGMGFLWPPFHPGCRCAETFYWK